MRRIQYLFLDMDGILADFVTGACIAHCKPNPYAYKDNAGVWNMEDIWKMKSVEFWKPLEGHRFWADLGKMPEADDLVTWALKEFGAENTAILTAPSRDPGCITGKREWVQKYYPELAGNLIFTAKKYFMAGPDRLLVDDRDLNITEWEGAGGHAYLFPRPWNSSHNFKMKYLENGEWKISE